LGNEGNGGQNANLEVASPSARAKAANMPLVVTLNMAMVAMPSRVIIHNPWSTSASVRVGLGLIIAARAVGMLMESGGPAGSFSSLMLIGRYGFKRI
jgi:hypothetical protein